MKKVNLTYKDAAELDGALAQAGAIKSHPKFSLAVGFNRRILKTFIEVLEEAQEMSDEMAEYDEARRAVINELGEQQTLPNGDVSTFVPADRRDDFEKKLNPLKKKYKAAIAEYDAQIKYLRDVTMNEPINEGKPIDLHELPKKLPPALSGNLIYALSEILPAGLI